MRLGLYRRLSTIEDHETLDGFAAELTDRFGPLPEEVMHLLRVVAIKIECRRAGISRLDVGPKGVVVSFRNDIFANPVGLLEWVQSKGSLARVRPDQKIVLNQSWETVEGRLKGAEVAARQIARIAQASDPAPVA